jgi:O-antigen ligase
VLVRAGARFVNGDLAGRSSKEPLLLHQLLFLVSLLGALGFLSYYHDLYFPEIAQGCTLVLFVWLASSTKTRKQGFYTVFLPAYSIALLVILYASVFSFRTGAPVLPSILAQRTYGFFLLAPVIYLLHLRGWRLADFERIFVCAAVLTIIGYFISYLTIDRESWALSGDIYKTTWVTYDETRGYRLKAPLFVLVFGVLYFGRRIPGARNLLSLGLMSALTALSIALLISNFPRSTVICTITALIIYKVFLSSPRYAKLALVLFPLLAMFGVFTLAYESDTASAAFGSDPSYTERVETAEKAWTFFQEHPFFGLGQASYYSLSFQDVMGNAFEPSDIGLLGVAFQYGLLGLSLYIFFSFWISITLLRLLWVCRDTTEQRQVAYVWTLSIISLAILIASPLQAKYIYEEGIGFGAFSLGLLLAYKYGLPRRFL